MTQPPRVPGRGGPARRSVPNRSAFGGRTGTGHANAGRMAPTGRGTGRVPGPRPVPPNRATPGARPTPATHNAPATRSASAGRPTTGAARRTNAPQPQRFTSRATVLGLVLGALLLAYAYPVRIYLEQQSRITAMETAQAAQQARIDQMVEESAKWDDPTFVASQATRTLQMVRPGSTAYFISQQPSSEPASTDPDAGRARDTGPWYGQLWSSVQAADKPRRAP